MMQPRVMPRAAWAALLSLYACLWGGSAWSQTYPTLSDQPNPADFVAHADSQLTLAGTPLRFGGLNISWLGLRQDAGQPPRRATDFEMHDALDTARAMGATVIRVPGLAATAGCALCLEPSSGVMSADAFARIDLLLKQATDLGLKVIIPLADQGADCTGADATGVVCGESRMVAGSAGRRAFFTNKQVRDAFLTRVRAIVTHTNALTGKDYRDDPAILAWEDCDGCAGSADDAAVSTWVEAVGQIVKANDHHHLYEEGAFAGRLAKGAAHQVGQALFATPSVDIVGDRPATDSDPKEARRLLEGLINDMSMTGRAYVIDAYGWAPTLWKNQADLESWLDDMARERALAGALTGDLQAHADTGGYLSASAPSAPGVAALYFPGVPTGEVDKDTMTQRGRALRRFDFAMADVTSPPAFLLPPQPQVISVKHGRIIWRGAAGAARYSVERSPDPSLPGTWVTLCDACTDDLAGGWEDKAPAGGTAWYRVMPFNVNGHKSLPSEPFKSE